MKIAFLGKGGSGKSTLATAFTRHLLGEGMRVLAIDADHNMDLAFNLGAGDATVFLGTDPHRIKGYIGADASASFRSTREVASEKGMVFRIEPMDDFTAAVAVALEPKLSIIIGGPDTDTVRSGESCSHILTSALKVYVPLLELGAGEAVVMDERAGTDPTTTGILEGVDAAMIVAEPTVHSVRVAAQIAYELALAGVRYEFVANKVRDDRAPFDALPKHPIAFVPFGAEIDAPEALRAIERAVRC